MLSLLLQQACIGTVLLVWHWYSQRPAVKNETNTAERKPQLASERNVEYSTQMKQRLENLSNTNGTIAAPPRIRHENKLMSFRLRCDNSSR
ncbi:hypothetical protein STEG23_011821 [Scotinomys teguina]